MREFVLLRFMARAPLQKPERIPHLTPTELEVLQLLCKAIYTPEKLLPGLSGKSLYCIKFHKGNLYRKCNAGNRWELLYKAITWKLVPCICGSQHEQVGSEPNDP